MWLFLFFVAAAINLYAEIFPNQLLTYSSKPLLMIFLGLHFWQHRQQSNRYTQLILAGLFFAFLGDTFLMIRWTVEQSELFFLLGLGSFLITQFCYCLAFINYAKGKGFVRANPWIILFFLTFLVGNTYSIWGGMPAAFRGPVVVYSTVITAMVISCLNLFKELPTTVFSSLFIGVLLFMLSDSLIGLSQFKKEAFTIPYSGFLIMSTYIMAQYLIVRGSLLVVNDE